MSLEESEDQENRLLYIQDQLDWIEDTKKHALKEGEEEGMGVPSKAKTIKLANPAQVKSNQQPVTELHTLGANK